MWKDMRKRSTWWAVTLSLASGPTDLTTHSSLWVYSQILNLWTISFWLVTKVSSLALFTILSCNFSHWCPSFKLTVGQLAFGFQPHHLTLHFNFPCLGAFYCLHRYNVFHVLHDSLITLRIIHRFITHDHSTVTICLWIFLLWRWYLSSFISIGIKPFLFVFSTCGIAFVFNKHNGVNIYVALYTLKKWDGQMIVTINTLKQSERAFVSYWNWIK